MARIKNANFSPGVWLGLLLVLVAHTLALSTRLENVPEYEDYGKHNDNSDNDSTVLRQLGPSAKRRDLDDGQEEIKDDAKDLYIRKRINDNTDQSEKIGDENIESYKLSEKNVEKGKIDEITSTIETQHENITRQKNEPKPTEATMIDFGNHSAKNESVEHIGITERNIEIEENQSVGKPTGTSHREFEFDEEHDNFEDHAYSERAEATTPSSKYVDDDQKEKIFDNLHKNIETFDTEQSNDAGNRVTISLANDTNVNYRPERNETNVLISNNGLNSELEPKHEIEVFKNVTHPSTLRLTEAIEGDIVIDNTTPYYTNTSKPKARTISNTGDNNDLSTKKPKNFSLSDADHTTSDTIMKIYSKKSGSTEKSTELKPYPYVKSETRFTDDKIVSKNFNTTEKTIEEISAYENTIGRKKSDDKIIVTEPSVLVENSIQQFKPINDKRSGNFSGVNSTFLNTSVRSTAWSATTEDLESKNATKVIEGSERIFSDNGTSSQNHNNVPQDNTNKSNTTERSPVILSEVTENNIETVIGKINVTYNLTASTPISKKLTERSEVTAEDIAGNTLKLNFTQVLSSTETIEDSDIENKNSSITHDSESTTKSISNLTESQATNSDSFLTSVNDNDTKIDHLDTTPKQINMTNESTEHPISLENISSSTEIYTSSMSNRTEKLNLGFETTVSLSTTVSTTIDPIEEYSSEMPTFQSTETEPIEESIANITDRETISESRESARTIPISSTSQSTKVEYEFVELTPELSSTISHSEVGSSEKIDTTTEFSNESMQTTESQDTVITDSPIDQNKTTFSRNIETDDPEIRTTSVTLMFDTPTTSVTNSEDTTEEDLSSVTNSPVSESSFTTITDSHTDATLSSTSVNDNQFHGRVYDVVTTSESYNPEETITTILPKTVQPIEETTTVSNIEVIVDSDSTSTLQISTTTTRSTTLHVQSTSELPEFPVSTDDFTLFVRVVIEGLWSDVCPVLSNLRQLLANLLTEGTGRTVLSRNIIFHQTQCSVETTSMSTLTTILLYVVDDNGDFDHTMTEILPDLYKHSPFLFTPAIHNVETLRQTESNNNAIAVVAISFIAFICLVLLAGLLFIMRKRQTRFNYGERCRPVDLDAFRVDSVSAYNSVRRKGLARASKRSYGNPAFEDSSVTPTHPLNFAGLSTFCNDTNAITEEFEGIPQVTARMDELPAGSEVKNRYANVAPLPETRVLLQKINNEPLTEYINASYVRGPKNATKYYIACQAPMESTVSDFWRMIWEQQSKVIIMLTDIIENGVEKCVEYIPPSEVTDCHRLYGDYQVTLKKREAKEKYAISTLHLKNLENNTYREVSHIWYLWPTNGVPSNGTGLIAVLLEARALQRGAPGPIVVHCSPGTGRTGTLIALDLGIRQYEITRTVDVPRVVYTIRRDRAGAVQTKEQYAFIYKALNLYAAKLAGGALESM